MNFLGTNKQRISNERKNFKISQRQKSHRQQSPYIEVKKRPQTGVQINNFKIKGCLGKNVSKKFNLQQKENIQSRCVSGQQQDFQKLKRKSLKFEQDDDKHNGKNLHKYLYLKKNEFQNKYNEITQSNKKLQTKLQQVILQKERLYQYAGTIKLQTCSFRTKNLSRYLDQKDLELIFSLSSPEQLKQDIVAKKYELDSLEKQYQHLCVITKGDNRLYLQNQSVFDNKILLTQVQKLKNIYQQKSHKICKNKNKFTKLQQTKLVQNLFLKELQLEQENLIKKIEKAKTNDESMQYVENKNTQKLNKKQARLAKQKKINEKIQKENDQLQKKINKIKKNSQKQKIKQEQASLDVKTYLQICSIDQKKLFDEFIQKQVDLENYENVFQKNQYDVQKLQNELELSQIQSTNLNFLLKNGVKITQIQQNFIKYKDKYTNIFINEQELVDNLQNILSKINNNIILGKNKIQLYLKKQHNMLQIQIDIIIKVLCDNQKENQTKIILSREIAEEICKNYQSDYSDNNSIQFHDFDEDVLKKVSQHSQNSIKQPKHQKTLQTQNQLTNNIEQNKRTKRQKKKNLSCTLETKTKETYPKRNSSKNQKHKNMRKIKISSSVTHDFQQTKIKKLQTIDKINQSMKSRNFNHKKEHHENGFQKLSTIIQKNILSQGFYCVYENLVQKILDSYIDQVQSEALNQLIYNEYILQINRYIICKKVSNGQTNLYEIQQ